MTPLAPLLHRPHFVERDFRLCCLLSKLYSPGLLRINPFQACGPYFLGFLFGLPHREPYFAKNTMDESAAWAGSQSVLVFGTKGEELSWPSEQTRHSTVNWEAHFDYLMTYGLTTVSAC